MWHEKSALSQFDRCVLVRCSDCCCAELLMKPESVCKQSVLSQKCPRDLLQEVKLLKST